MFKSAFINILKFLEVIHWSCSNKHTKHERTTEEEKKQNKRIGYCTPYLLINISCPCDIF